MLEFLLIICPILACACNGATKTNNVIATNGSTGTGSRAPLTAELFGHHLAQMDTMPIFDELYTDLWGSYSAMAINYLDKTSRPESQCRLSGDQHLRFLDDPEKLARHCKKYIHEDCSDLYNPRPWKPELRVESLFFAVDPEHKDGGIVFKVAIKRKRKQTRFQKIKAKTNGISKSIMPKDEADSEPEEPKRKFGEKKETYKFAYVRRKHLQEYICIDAKLRKNVYAANTSPVNGERCFEQSFVFDYQMPEVQSLWGANGADKDESFEFYRKKLINLSIIRTSAYEDDSAWVHERSWMDDAGLKASLFFTINAFDGGYVKLVQLHDIGPTKYKYTDQYSRSGPSGWQSNYQRTFLDADEFKKDKNKYICVLRKIHVLTFEVALRRIAKDGCFLAQPFVHNAPLRNIWLDVVHGL